MGNGDDFLDNLCDKCWYNVFDEELEEYYCSLEIDEDEYAKFLLDSKNGNKSCKYFRPDGGEYEIVRRQN